MNNNRNDERAIQAGCKGVFSVSGFIGAHLLVLVHCVLYRVNTYSWGKEILHGLLGEFCNSEIVNYVPGTVCQSNDPNT